MKERTEQIKKFAWLLGILKQIRNLDKVQRRNFLQRYLG